MPPIEFSALSMPITAPGSDGVLRTLERLDGKGQELSKTIGKQLQNDLAGLQRLANSALKDMEKGAATGVQEFRNAVGAQREYMQSLGATEAQLLKLDRVQDQFDRKLQSTGDHAKHTGHMLNQMSIAFTATGVIFGLEKIALGTDKVADGVRGALQSLSMMTAMMGPYGIATSVVLGGVAAVMDYFDQLDKRAAESSRKFREELAGIVRSGNLMGAATQAQYLYSGDVGAAVEKRLKNESEAEYFGRKNGIVGLRAEAARLQAIVGPLQARAKDMSLTPQERNAAAGAIDGKVVQQLNAINAVLAEQEKRYREVSGVVDDLTKKETERARAQLEGWQEKDAKKNANKTLHRLPVLEEAGPSYAEIAAAVVQSETGGKLAQRTDRLTSGILGDLAGVDAAELSKSISEAIRAAAGSIGPAIRQFGETTTREVKEEAKRIQSVLEDSLVGAFQRGFATGSIGGFIKSFGQTFLGMLGQLFIEIGKKLINFGAIATTIANAIKTLGIFSGPMALAAGVALIALGAGMGAMAGGGGGGGGGGYGGGSGGYGRGAPMVIDRGLINPVNPITSQAAGSVKPQTPVAINNPVFIGRDDRRAQREIMELIRNAQANNIG